MLLVEQIERAMKLGFKIDICPEGSDRYVTVQTCDHRPTKVAQRLWTERLFNSTKMPALMIGNCLESAIDELTRGTDAND